MLMRSPFYTVVMKTITALLEREIASTYAYLPFFIFAILYCCYENDNCLTGVISDFYWVTP